MTLVEQVDKDMVAAMKAREELRLETLRMMKSALKMKQIEKRAPLEDAEAQQVLTTLIKQRRESAEMFLKGNRPELAEKEQKEIAIIEHYLPKSAGEDDIRAAVHLAIEEFATQGAKPGPRDMGAVIRGTQARLAAQQLRADGRQVSEMVKAELAK